MRKTLTRRHLLLSTTMMASGAPPKSRMGVATTCYMTVRRFRDTMEFLEHCHALGAAGIQSAITSFAPDDLRRLRSRAEQYGMWIEVMAGLPRSDNDETFSRTLAAAKELGALCVRAACLGGRRYETFSSMDEWQRFVASSRLAVKRALPAAEKSGVVLCLENHKDWIVDELLALLQEYSSEHLGVCLDTGNNIALLDDPMDVIRRLAPYAASTHIKDMAVAEYPEGFLLAEVPFGEGMLDLAEVVSIIQKARPKTKMTLEMITRDPLRVPCLTPKFWATFEGSGAQARRLAHLLTLVRNARLRKPIPMLSTLPASAQRQLEEDNVKLCLHYARERLGL